MATSIPSFLNQSLNDSSFTLSPNAAGKRKVSLSRAVLDKKRKSLMSFQKSDNDQEQLNQSPQISNQRDSQDDGEEFGITLKSLHEINSRSFNPTNAFKYNFINCLDAFIKQKVNFKIFGIALDAGTKIYSSKVDLLYNGAQKISSSLSMATDEQNFSMDDEGIVDDVNAGKNAKRKRGKIKNITTIATNVETLNGKLETNIEIDPLFHHLSAAFDVGNVDSLLMANLCMNPQGTLLLDSKVNLNFDSCPNLPNKLTSFPFLKPEYVFENLYVCKYFKDFEFSRRDLNVDIEEVASNRCDTETNLNFDFDINADVDEIHDSGEFDLEGIHESSPFDGDDSDDGNTNNNREESFEKNILKFLPENDEENQFFNRNFLRSTFKNVTRYNNLIEKKKPVTKKTRQPFQQNNYDISENVRRQKCSRKELNVFCEQVVNKWSINSVENQLEDVRLDSRLFNLKTCQTKNLFFTELNSKKKDDNAQIETNDDYDDDLFIHDDDYDNREDIRHENDQITDSCPVRSLNLDSNTHSFDQEPIHVDALDIDYAKVAKKIDIKKVKLGMWDFIQKETTEIIDFNIETSSNGGSQKNVTFSDLRLKLPTMLSTNLNVNLSTPISFVALLHLCNEKNLQLKNEQNYGDFFIATEN